MRAGSDPCSMTAPFPSDSASATGSVVPDRSSMISRVTFQMNSCSRSSMLSRSAHPARERGRGDQDLVEDLDPRELLSRRVDQVDRPVLIDAQQSLIEAHVSPQLRLFTQKRGKDAQARHIFPEHGEADRKRCGQQQAEETPEPRPEDGRDQEAERGDAGDPRPCPPGSKKVLATISITPKSARTSSG